MTEFHLTDAARQQGVQCLLGLAVGSFARIMAEVAYIPALGIPCGGVAFGIGLLLWRLQRHLGFLPCLCLCLLGITTFLYGLEGVLLFTVIGRLTESMLVIFYIGYFIYGLLHGIMFFYEATKFSKNP
ncbi:MAG: hypothetical protein J6R67_04965 [Treponema sp.]|nr:hypothetical protein [Treponema sp.]